MSPVKQQEKTIQDGTWSVDRAHSSAGFAVEHSGVSKFRGQLAGFDAGLRVEHGRAVLEGAADPHAIRVEHEDLSAHLQSPEFFDSETHPTVRFASRPFAIQAGAQTIEAELELRGERREVSVEAVVSESATGPDGAERVGVALATTIDRTDYGFDWQMELPNGGQALANEVELTAELELVRQDG